MSTRERIDAFQDTVTDLVTKNFILIMVGCVVAAILVVVPLFFLILSKILSGR